MDPEYLAAVKEKKKVKKKELKRMERRFEISIATLNIVTLNGKMEEVIDTMQTRKLDILGLSETKWKGVGSKELRDGYKIWWSGGKEGKNGVGIVVSPEIKEDIIEIKNSSDRMIKMEVLIGKRQTNIIQVYAPQVGRPMDEKASFIDSIEREITSERVIIMGDMNAKVGENQKGWDGVLGAHGYGRRDKEGEMLLEMCSRNSLVIANSIFKKKVKHKITRYGWDGETESVIDYIVVSKEMMPVVRDVKVIPSIALDGDHRLLVATIKAQKLRKNTKLSRTKKLKIWQLQEEKLRELFRKKTQGKIPQGDLKDVEEEWCALRNTLVGITEELCGRVSGKRKRKETPWWNENVKAAVKQKKETWKKKEEDRSIENILKYEQSKKEVKETVKLEKQKSMVKLAEKLKSDFMGTKRCCTV